MQNHNHNTRHQRRVQLELQQQQQQQQQLQQQRQQHIAMAQINPEEATLRQLLTTANVPADVIDVIVLEGMEEFEACIYFSYKAVCAIALRKSRQPTPVAINTVSCWRIATVALYVQGKL